MSPEQVRGRPVDGRSDLFSLGVILYQLSTGRRPFGEPGTTLAALFHGIAHLTPPEPAELNAEVAPRLSRVIMRCLSKDPSERYASGAALTEALRECRVSGHGGPLTRLLGGFERHTSSVGFLHVFFLVALMLAAVLFHLFPETTEDVAGSPGRRQGAPTAALTVQTRPAGAAITVDGAVIGSSPLEVQLPPGKHRVTAKLEGHAVWSRELDMDEAASTPLDIQLRALAKNTASQVFTAPPGAILVGAAASVGGPPESEHQAAAAPAEPLPEARRQAHDDGSGHTRTRKPLKPENDRAEAFPEIQGILQIESTPTGAEVLVDGKAAGTTPFVTRVPEGEHVVVLRDGDRNVWEQRLNVESGKEYPFKVALNGVESILAVESDPPGARILVDGVPKGTTPSKLQLPPGKHQVRMKLKRHKDYQAQVDLARAGEQSLKARLKPVQPAPRRIAAYRPPPPDPVSTMVREARYQLSPRTLWRRVQNLF
jgi:serine/threonine-protein kinase